MRNVNGVIKSYNKRYYSRTKNIVRFYCTHEIKNPQQVIFFIRCSFERYLALFNRFAYFINQI